MEKQHITLAGVKAACIVAYDENRLAAQNPDSFENNDGGDYYYRRGDFGCAIGVALTPETAKQIDDDNGAYTLSGEPEILADIFSWPQAEFKDLAAIQLAHDNWLNATVNRSTWTESDAENEFRHLIGYTESRA